MPARKTSTMWLWTLHKGDGCLCFSCCALSSFCEVLLLWGKPIKTAPYMIWGPFLTRVHIYIWLPNVAYRTGEVKLHECWPRLIFLTPLLWPDLTKCTRHHHPQQFLTKFDIWQYHNYIHLCQHFLYCPHIVTYVHCSCTGNAHIEIRFNVN